MAETNIIRIPPFQYIHVLDFNTNITRVIEGPLTFIRKEHEKLVTGPEQMIKIPPRSYCIIQNPVLKDLSTGELIQDSLGMIKVKFGDSEVRTNESHPNPFPLYPWERVDTKITKIPIIQQNCAYKLRATRDYVDDQGNFRQAGEEWLHKGPCSYIPQVACEVLQEVKPFVIKPNSAIKIKATRKTTDIYGNERQAGEEWLIKESGAYLPQVDEEIVSEVKALVLTERKGYHIRALNDFKDAYGVDRRAGEEWLVTLKNADTHIPDVYEEVIKEVKAYVLTNRQFCYILDPVDPKTGYNKFGKKILKQGECTFFLQPYESLEKGIQDVYVLGEEEALLLRAKENFEETKDLARVAGERWMIYGPCDYIPPIQVEVITRRVAIPLDENEGVYVRNLKTGEVTAITGQCYMLKPYEELWELELPDIVEELIFRQNQGIATQIPKAGHSREVWAYEEIKVTSQRDKTKVVTFKVPHNSAVQVYDFKKNKSRVVFGPDRILLGPDEQFTVLNLSGSTPKRENQIKNLALLLGPDFMTDVVIVETSDHATLQLKLSYNWFFDIDKGNEDQCNKIFQVKDFVGDACKTIASRVRGAVSTQTFENFHSNSAEIIKAGVFGRSGDQIRSSLRFPANNLVITNVDLHNLAPTDARTQESLQKSVNLAIEIMTKSQEDKAEHESKRQEQHQAGLLHLQKVKDAIDAQASQIRLAELQAKSTEIELTSKAVALAKSQAASQYIQYETMVKETEFEVQAKSIKQVNELKTIREQHQAEIEHQKALKDLEIQKARDLADIETGKFKQIVTAIGTETIVSMARAGPAAQARILKALGLKGFMVMNSKNPINLLGTAQGFLKQDQQVIKLQYERYKNLGNLNAIKSTCRIAQ